MANPQKENGFTPLANEIWEHLALIRIPGECWQVLSVIFRQTYGFHKKSDRISLGQFAKKTGLKIPNVSRSLSKLIIMGIIKKDNGGDRKVIPFYSFNKDYDTWISLSKKIITIIKKDNEMSTSELSKKIDTKDIKDIFTKDKEEKRTFKKISDTEIERGLRKDSGSPINHIAEFLPKI